MKKKNHLSLLLLVFFCLSTQFLVAQIEQLPGKAIDLAGNEEGDLFSISVDKQLQRFNFSTNTWEAQPSPANNLKRVAAARDRVFVIDTHGNIYFSSNPVREWEKITGAYKDVGGSGKIITALDIKNKLWQYNFNRNRFVQLKISPGIYDELCVYANHAYINDDRDVTLRVADGFTLKETPGKCHDLAGSLKNLFKVGAEYRINRYKRNTNEWTTIYLLKADFKRIAVSKEIPYATDNNNEIFKITVH